MTLRKDDISVFLTRTCAMKCRWMASGWEIGNQDRRFGKFVGIWIEEW